MKKARIRGPKKREISRGRNYFLAARAFLWAARLAAFFALLAL